jgi:hypothetical protein
MVHGLKVYGLPVLELVLAEISGFSRLPTPSAITQPVQIAAAKPSSPVQIGQD